MNDQHEQVLRDYFRHLDHPADADLLDVVESVDEFALTSPVEAWPLVRALIHIAPSEYALDYVAAGPLETLLINHGEVIAPIIAADASVDPRIQDALAHAILSEPIRLVSASLGQWLLRSPRT